MVSDEFEQFRGRPLTRAQAAKIREHSRRAAMHRLGGFQYAASSHM